MGLGPSSIHAAWDQHQLWSPSPSWAWPLPRLLHFLSLLPVSVVSALQGPSGDQGLPLVLTVLQCLVLGAAGGRAPGPTFQGAVGEEQEDMEPGHCEHGGSPRLEGHFSLASNTQPLPRSVRPRHPAHPAHPSRGKGSKCCGS